MSYVNFDSTWVNKAMPKVPGDSTLKSLTGYRIDGESGFTETPNGFSVPCTVERVEDQVRIRFDNTFWVRWNGGHGDTDYHNEWFGKTSVYFDDYLNLSEEPLCPFIVDLMKPDTTKLGTMAYRYDEEKKELSVYVGSNMVIALVPDVSPEQYANEAERTQLIEKGLNDLGYVLDDQGVVRYAENLIGR